MPLPASGDPVELEQVHPGGVFEGVVEGAELPLAYRLEVDYGESGKVTIEDPYRFLPTIGELDLHLVGEGRHEELWATLGAHVREIEGVRGTAFTVWAPSARAVSRGRRLQLLGRPRPPDARDRARPASGSCSCPTSAPAPATSTRCSRPTARSA